MPMTFRTILALTSILAVQAVHARADDLNQPPETAPSSVGIASDDQEKAGTKRKQKERVLLLVEQARALARWMPNEASFLAVLDRAQERLVAAKEIDLAPMAEFEPYLSNLTATLARMDARVGALQVPVELCDPSRKGDRFLLFLDALDADGQGKVQGRICEKLAFEAEPEGSLSQVCVAASLGLLVARSMRDLVVVCEPSLADASPDASGPRFEQLSVELAGVQASVEKSVQASKRELTQAFSVVAGHVADVSSVNMKQLEDFTVRLEIERALQQGLPYGSIYLPEANGGRLELVRAIVLETVRNVIDSGESANQAATKLVAGDEQLKGRHFKQAFRLYSEAYKAAVALPSKPR